MALRLEARAAANIRRWRMVVRQVESHDGWETLQVQFDHPEEAVFVVLGMGARAEVLGPESIRERVAQEIRGMAERIGG